MSRLLDRPSPSRIKNRENAFIGGQAYALPLFLRSFYVQYNMSEEIRNEEISESFSALDSHAYRDTNNLRPASGRSEDEDGPSYLNSRSCKTLCRSLEKRGSL